MIIRYSKHLLIRLKMRGIPKELPRVIYNQATMRYLDILSDIEVAVMKTILHNKQRDVALFYRKDTSIIHLITIHPLKSGQLENRLRSGRWIEL